MRLWIDDTELESDTKVGTPDVFVYGGIGLNPEQEKELLVRVREIKSKYTKSEKFQYAPIKWNFKDLKADYESAGGDFKVTYKALLDSSKDWRAEIFDAIAKSEAKLFVAPVEAFSPNKETVIETRAQCARYGFTNALQRFAMYVRMQRINDGRIVVDWPQGGERSIVEKEYERAFAEGKTLEGYEYSSGPLHKLGFDDAPMFSITQQSALLQVADLLVGAARYFLSATLHGKDYGSGLSCLKQVRDNFHGGAEKAIKYSFVPSGNGRFRSLVKDAVYYEMFERTRPEGTGPNCA